MVDKDDGVGGTHIASTVQQLIIATHNFGETNRMNYNSPVQAPSTPTKRKENTKKRKQKPFRKAISQANDVNASESSDEEDAESDVVGTTPFQTIQDFVDWSETAESGTHIWIDYDSGHNCYMNDIDNEHCQKSNLRKRCVACKIVTHVDCIPMLYKNDIYCRPTFYDPAQKGDKETIYGHHWVKRKKLSGKCSKCNKSLSQQGFFFQTSRDFVAIICSWCKVSYHMKEPCWTLDLLNEECNFGQLANQIVPPSWLVKIPCINDDIKHKQKPRNKKENSIHSAFTLKPITSTSNKPLLVFINPKSGGNQGAKILHQFHWLLNPRQVFDLSQQGGPEPALEFYRKAPNLQILVCGGDGTVGWILATLDSLDINPRPPVAILPLGTGNDLSRTLYWGAGYGDESVDKILQYVNEGQIIQLDRWNLKVQRNLKARYDLSAEDAPVRLPINVMNNYFSLGVDAQTTLDFHESREANPEKFNSRIKNKMFYAGAGGRGLFQWKSRDLVDNITLECDGEDLTPKVRELKLCALALLNISKYGAGTTPWGNPNPRDYPTFRAQRFDDGYLEVVGLTASSLAGLFVGGHGERITQCRTVKITTFKVLPVQVDGEPCRLAPSIIRVSIRNQAQMLQRSKRKISRHQPLRPTTSDVVQVKVHRVTMADFRAAYYDGTVIKAKSHTIGCLELKLSCSLEEARPSITKFFLRRKNHSVKETLWSRWFFLDVLGVYSQYFFHIDPCEEVFHTVSEYMTGGIYVLDLLPENRRSALSDSEDITEIDHHQSLYRVISASDPEIDVCLSNEASKSRNRRIEGNALKNRRLLEACRTGNCNQVENLLSAGASPTFTDSGGRTALHYAICYGQLQTLKILLLKLAPMDLNVADTTFGHTGLHCAIACRHTSIIHTMLAAGASATGIADYMGLSSLSLAIKLNYLEVVDLIQETKRNQSTSKDDCETTV